MPKPPVNPHIISRPEGKPGARPAAVAPWPLAVVAAWVVPGLGHVLIGETKRGVVAGASLITLFITGLFIGGVGVVDRLADPVPLWYVGQILIGPTTIALNSYHQSLKQQLHDQIEQHADDMREAYRYKFETPAKDQIDPRIAALHITDTNASPSFDDAKLDLLISTTQTPVYRLSIGRVNELGTLYCTLAGVLNLLLILDVVGRGTGEIPSTPKRERVPAPQTDGGAA